MRSPRRPPALVDPIGVLEAAYRLDGTDREWLEGVCNAVRPLLDGGLGLYAYFYDVAEPLDQWLSSLVLQGPTEMSVKIIEFSRGVSRATLEYCHVHPSLYENGRSFTRLVQAETRSDGVPAGDVNVQPVSDMMHADAFDVCSLRTLDPSGRGLFVGGLTANPRPIPAPAKRLWSRVAAHVGAGLRLRRALTGGDARRGQVEAVLEPSGAVQHVERESAAGRAVEALREAVLVRERSRGRGRRDDPAGALEAWRALVDGRWSLVDQFERGGRRYIVARRNEHAVPDPRALTARERDVVALATLGHANKLIGYELGLSRSTVATHLTGAMAKLGANSRTELVGTVGPLLRARPTPGGRP